MTDDFVAGGILPIDDAAIIDTEFDPDAVESDVFLDDPKDEILLDDELVDLAANPDDELIEGEI